MSAPTAADTRKNAEITKIEEQMSKLGINAEHFSSVQQINRYL